MSDAVRILLVEDDEGDAFIIQTLLEEGERAYDMTRVSLLKEAFDVVEAEDFDIVILDLSLPDSTGLETFTQMERRAPNVPIVVMTGMTDEALARKAVNLGAQDFLVKGSVSEASLKRAIGYALERHDATERLRRLAILDELTGLHNRRGFTALGEQQLRIARRNAAPLLIVFIDLDDMKRINDSLGHQVGDQALVDTARILKHTFRESDIVARMGGDEFCALLPGTPESRAGRVLQRLEEAVRAHNSSMDRPYELSFSAGIEQYDPSTNTSLEELTERADRAMYAHKTRGEQRPRLLVIDDDDAIAALAERIFSSVFDVSASATGIEGVLRAVEESPDIILLDFELPDMSGVDVTRDLRNRRETALIPIIMITGHGDSEDRKTLELESLAAGVDDYVSKPFDAKALTLRVANLLSRAGARR